jgi:hypothetical protein
MKLQTLLLTVLSGGGVPFIALYDSGNSIAIANGDASPATADGTDFGLTPSLTTVTKTYTIRNTGTAQLTISAISVPSGFTQLTALPINIAAAATATFQVRFDALTPIAYSGNVSITHNAAGSPYTFAITGSSLYSARVLATTPLRYNQLSEGSGTTIVDSGSNGYTGTYTGITWDAGQSPPMLGSVPFFDGTNDYGDLYSAAFGTAMNLDEFTFLLWLKVRAASVWTDGAARRILMISRNINNRFYIEKGSSNNNISFERTGNSTSKSVSVGSQSDTGWVCLAGSASVAGGGLLAAGESRFYKNGVQIGATQTGNIASAGSGLSSTATVIGATNTTPANIWDGYLGHLIIWNRPIDAEILALMTV